MHTISTVYIASGRGIPRAADDAVNLATFCHNSLPEILCFDHALILADYYDVTQAMQNEGQEQRVSNRTQNM